MDNELKIVVVDWISYRGSHDEIDLLELNSFITVWEEVNYKLDSLYLKTILGLIWRL